MPKPAPAAPKPDPTLEASYRQGVEELAGQEGISLRTGCFCNPGAGEIAEGLNEEDMRAAWELGPALSLQTFLSLIQSRGHNKSLGAIRASVGIASNFADVYRFVEFAEGFRDVGGDAI